MKPAASLYVLVIGLLSISALAAGEEPVKIESAPAAQERFVVFEGFYRPT